MKKKLFQNSATAFLNTNLLRKVLNTYDLPPINATESKEN